MIRKFIMAATLLLLTHVLPAQQTDMSGEIIASYLEEVRRVTKKSRHLWGTDLYGPLLLVDPDTRQAYANVSDSAGVLRLQGEVYTGTLPAHISIANTSLRWGGKHWAMLMLPLPAGREDRLNLMGHELFHVAQAALGYKQFNPSNDHLDQKQGRIYLRLELEALTKALQSPSRPIRKMHLANALTFRKYRHALYPDAATAENQLELNEGLAEYTGLIISNRPKAQGVAHLTGSIHAFLSNPTFVRSFAYQTVPVYGYLLSGLDKDWNKSTRVDTHLTDFFIAAFGITLPADLKNAALTVAEEYNAQTIIQEETVRDEERKRIMAAYKKVLVELPHLEIRFENMRISFDPRNLMPLEDKGTVYPNITVTDKWGVLKVNKQALMSPNWDRISVTPPTSIEGSYVEGDGWTLELSEGYSIQKDEQSGNFALRKH